MFESDYSSVSEESDDLPTPLQIWQRLYDSVECFSEKSYTTEPSDVQKHGVVLIKKTVSKRKTRRRLISNDIHCNSSSDEDVTVKRKLRLRTRKNSKEKSQPCRSRKFGLKSNVTDNNSQNDLEITTEDFDFSTTNKTALVKRETKSFNKRKKINAQPVRRSTRLKKQSRKRPIEFLENTSELSRTEKSDREDSIKTILLSTPDFSSFDNDEACIPQSPSDSSLHEGPSRSKNSCSITEVPESDSESHVVENANESLLLKHTIFDGDNQIVDENNSSKDAVVPSSRDDQKLSKIDYESSALDDIFFKSSSSKRKPPPGRSQKKTTGM